MQVMRTIFHLDEKATSRVEVLRTGSFYHQRYGEFEITEESIDQIIANFNEYEDAGRIPFDYNHSSLDHNVEAAVAAGWILSLEKVPKAEYIALIAEVDWTDRAKEYIESDEYRFVSPEFTFHYADRESGQDKGARLMAAALTNRPFLPDMDPVALSIDEKTYLTILQLDTHGKDSLMERVNCVVRSFYNRFKDNEFMSYVIEDVRDEDIVVRRNSNGQEQMVQIGYAIKEGICEFDPLENWQKVKKQYVVLSDNKSVKMSDEGDGVMEKKLRELLGIGEKDSLEEAIIRLKTQAEEVTKLTQELADLKVEVEELGKGEEEEGREEDKVELTQAQESLFKLTQENDKLKTQVEAYSAEVQALSIRLNTLETARRTSMAGERIKKAIQERRLLPAEVDISGDKQPIMFKLAHEQPEVFDQIIASRPEYDARMFIELSSGGDNQKDAGDKEDEFWTLVDKTISENPKLTQQQARQQVLVEHPEFKTVFAVVAG